MATIKYYNLSKYILFPINRSITGSGVKKTLRIIKKEFPDLKIKKATSGTKVFDWKIPAEWNVSDAYVEDKFGKKIIDFKLNNLHLIGYSIPLNKKITKKELFKNLHYLKKKPNAIPYVTSYYKKRWGFCVNYKTKLFIDRKYNDKDKFNVVIKSKFNKKGHLNYGELILKGKSKEEILISTYICHPSMANNELSGPTVSMCLIDHFKKKSLNKTIRFIFVPETIGSITYLSKNLKNLKKNVIGGYNLSCIGDDRQHSCMLTKYQNTVSDESLLEAYRKLKIRYKMYSFMQRASDERQYNSPGIELPIASIFRTKYNEYPEYHTSLDDFKLVTITGIRGGFRVAKKSVEILMKKILPKYKILCEPQMGRRGLYPTLSTLKPRNQIINDYMDFLQYVDGKNSLEKISTILNKRLSYIKKIYKKLKKKINLLKLENYFEDR